MQNSQNKKTLQIVLIVLVAVLTLGIGYAAISAVNLIINGNATANVNQNNFKVHFTQAQAITGTTGVSGTSTIDAQDDTKAMFDVTGLTKVGDYAEAVYIVRNDSNGVGAEISLSVSNSNSEYFKVTESIADTQLQAGDSTIATVTVEMIKTPIESNVTTSVSAKLVATPVENAQAVGNSSASKTSDDPVSFETDSWATIKKAVQNNNTDAYNVGDTKEVLINGNKYTLRIVNKTTLENCSNDNYSETACGFVVEFVDIITRMRMRDTSGNIGGYPATLVYDYLENILYNQLPQDLQMTIKSTRVISGHGRNDSRNFTTNNKLYLLSGVELYGSDSNDTAANTTTQLQYYIGKPDVEKIKQYSGNDCWYWLRSTYYSSYYGLSTFGSVSYTSGSYGAYTYVGRWEPVGSSDSGGVAPAFRIG